MTDIGKKGNNRLFPSVRCMNYAPQGFHDRYVITESAKNQLLPVVKLNYQNYWSGSCVKRVPREYNGRCGIGEASKQTPIDVGRKLNILSTSSVADND